VLCNVVGFGNPLRGCGESTYSKSCHCSRLHEDLIVSAFSVRKCFTGMMSNFEKIISARCDKDTQELFAGSFLYSEF
jgi:hypothetical protein